MKAYAQGLPEKSAQISAARLAARLGHARGLFRGCHLGPFDGFAGVVREEHILVVTTVFASISSLFGAVLLPRDGIGHDCGFSSRPS